ncbi:MAG: hypothetical protein HUU35_14645, partial [Armatimonadetes bacterium]|nr:hypothetical protein [Armatimonadota bacterium]
MVPLALYLSLLTAPAWQLNEQKLTIAAEALGNLDCDWPKLVGEKEVPPAEVRAAAGGVRLTYPGGAALWLGIEGTALVMRPTALPEGARLRLGCLLPFVLNEGGRWSTDGQTLHPFPVDKPAKPHLYQGHDRLLRLLHADGSGFDLRLPEGAYQQLQDNREWGWKIFAWSTWLPAAGQAELRLPLTAAQGAAVGGLRIDPFGQEVARDWPSKVKDEAELRADAAADAAYYGSFPKFPRDRFGGLPDSGAALGLKGNGFFQTAKVNGRWLLVDPDGNAFYHAAICCFQPSNDYTYVPGREETFAWLPPRTDPRFKAAWRDEPYWSDKAVSFYIANVIRKSGQPFELGPWQGAMVDRVRALGFTSIGAFSHASEQAKAKQMPYVATLPLGEWTLGRQIPGLRGFFDPFDPVTVAKIEQLFAESLPRRASDPLLLGYYLDNEQAAEDIPRVIPTLPASAPVKQALVAMLRAKYPTVAAFNAAWGLTAQSLDELAGQGLPVTTQAAADDLAAFTEQFLDRYYQVIVTAYRQHDPNHLLLGNRWQPSTANREVLVRTAARYLDVMSVNYYTNAFDPAFLRRLAGWSGDKPWILSEWHYSSPRDSGLPGGAREASSQEARGEAYRHYVEQAASLGFVVGHEWFTLIDQARTGRYFQLLHGENGNTGLFSVADRPWKPLVEAAAATHARLYDVLLGKVEPYRSALPELTPTGGGRRSVTVPHLARAVTLDGRGDDWPVVPPEQVSEARLTQGTQKVGLEASFRLAWDARALYLWAEVTDPTPRRNEQTGVDLWNADALELFIGHEALEQPGALRFTDRQILIGVGQPPRCHVVRGRPGEEIQAVVVDRVDGRGYVVEAAG